MRRTSMVATHQPPPQTVAMAWAIAMREAPDPGRYPRSAKLVVCVAEECERFWQATFSWMPLETYMNDGLGQVTRFLPMDPAWELITRSVAAEIKEVQEWLDERQG